MITLGSVFVVCLLLSGSLGRTVLHESMFDDNEIVKVRIDQTRSLSGGLSLSFDSDNRGLRHLDLEKGELAVSPNVRLTHIGLKSDGTLQFTDIPHNVNISQLKENIYSNLEHGSFLHIEGNDVYGLLTADMNIQSLGDGSHQIKKMERPTGKMCGTVDTQKSFTESTLLSSHDERSSISVYPEFIVFVDSALYNYIKKYSPFTNQPDNTKALYYLALFWSSVNLAYKTLNKHGLITKLNLNGIYTFSNATEEASVFNPAIIDADKNTFDTDKLMDGFARLLYNDRNLLPTYDFAYFQIGRGRSFGGQAADHGAACKSPRYQKAQNSAIGEDKRVSFGGVRLAAHETAHVLGATHDGVSEQTDSCPADERRIMYAHWPRAGSENFFVFSSCTANYIKAFAKTAAAACLTDKKSSNLNNYPLPGQYYDANSQCARFYGDGYVSALSGPDICRRLRCKKGNTVEDHSYFPPLQGTACGNGKMCRHGECV